MPRHRFVVMELAANGYGDPGRLMETRVDIVMDAYDHLQFKARYEVQSYRIRNPK